MGLDGVELLMAVEEEFGIEIPDHAAEKMTTVGDTYEFLKRELKAVPPNHCLKQKLFFKFRRALIENYKIDRREITLEKKLKDLVEAKDLKEGWPFMTLYSELEYPGFKVPYSLFKSRFDVDNQTVAEVLTTMMTVNEKNFPPEKDSIDDVWVRLVKVICYERAADSKEVQPHSKYVGDLGVG